MNSRRCILHIGPAKTGTTAIQASLSRNAALLKARGILYPTMERNHRFLVSSVMTAPERFDFNIRKGRAGADIEMYHTEMRRRFEEEIAESDCSTVFLSSEHCGLLDVDETRRLHDYLNRMFSRVRILLFARNPEYHVPSLIQERVKNGASRLADCLTDPPQYSYSETIPAWQSVFGEDGVEVLKYPGDPPQRANVINVLLSYLGVQDIEGFQQVQANTSLCAAALLLADAASEFAPKSSRERYLQKHLKKIKGPPFRLPAETKALVKMQSEPENAYLKDRWGIEFGDADGAQTEVPTDAFSEETLASIAQLLNDLSEVVSAQPKAVGRKG